ncbi:MAG: hypothetical protein R6U11_06130 [Bacteroidales bacterium]
MITAQDVHIAKANWKDWISVFEYEGAVEKNPLLIYPGVFNKFLGEYSVHRTIRAGKSDEFRKALCSGNVGLSDKLSDSSGKGVDDLEELLRWDFGTMEGKRRMMSVISKIAAFLAPANFIAWDKFARKGIIRLRGRRATHTYKTYAEYLFDMNYLLDGEMKDSLESICQYNYPSQYSSMNNRFNRRVLDVYLMRIGGRWG